MLAQNGSRIRLALVTGEKAFDEKTPTLKFFKEGKVVWTLNHVISLNSTGTIIGKLFEIEYVDYVPVYTWLKTIIRESEERDKQLTKNIQEKEKKRLQKEREEKERDQVWGILIFFKALFILIGLIIVVIESSKKAPGGGSGVRSQV